MSADLPEGPGPDDQAPGPDPATASAESERPARWIRVEGPPLTEEAAQCLRDEFMRRWDLRDDWRRGWPLVGWPLVADTQLLSEDPLAEELPTEEPLPDRDGLQAEAIHTQPPDLLAPIDPSYDVRWPPGFVRRPDLPDPDPHRCDVPAEWPEGAVWRCERGHLWVCGDACECRGHFDRHRGRGFHTEGRVWRPASLWQRLRYGGRAAREDQGGPNRVELFVSPSAFNPVWGRAEKGGYGAGNKTADELKPPPAAVTTAGRATRRADEDDTRAR